MHCFAATTTAQHPRKINLIQVKQYKSEKRNEVLMNIELIPA
jgi:hypothetical protein